MPGSFNLPQPSEHREALTQRSVTGLPVSMPRSSNLGLFPHNFFGCLKAHDQAQFLNNRKVKMERKYTLVPTQELHAGIQGGGKRWFSSEGLTHSATQGLTGTSQETNL